MIGNFCINNSENGVFSRTIFHAIKSKFRLWEDNVPFLWVVVDETSNHVVNGPINNLRFSHPFKVCLSC